MKRDFGPPYKQHIQHIQQRLSSHTPAILGETERFRSAVLLPLTMHQGKLQVLFEKRALHLRRQPGEICFPGGRRDEADDTALETAVRETCEELGLNQGSLKVLGALDRVVNPFQTVDAYVGWIEDSRLIRPSADEVDRVFYVEFEELVRTEPSVHYVEIQVVPEDDFPYDKIPGGRAYPWRMQRIAEYFYEFDGHVIWGLTARILHHFVEVVG